MIPSRLRKLVLLTAFVGSVILVAGTYLTVCSAEGAGRAAGTGPPGYGESGEAAGWLQRRGRGDAATRAALAHLSHVRAGGLRTPGPAAEIAGPVPARLR